MAADKDEPKESAADKRARHAEELDRSRARLETVAGNFPHVGKDGPAAQDLEDAAREFAVHLQRDEDEADARREDADKAAKEAEKAEKDAEKAEAKVDADKAKSETKVESSASRKDESRAGADRSERESADRSERDDRAQQEDREAFEADRNRDDAKLSGGAKKTDNTALDARGFAPTQSARENETVVRTSRRKTTDE